MLKTLVKDEIEKVLKKENLATEGLLVEETKFGDFSTNVAMRLKKTETYQNPLQIAKFLVSRLEKNELFSEVSFAPPGFINFTVDPATLASLIQKITEEGEKWGSSTKNKKKQAQVEFVSANPTGPLHVGNARGGPLGDSLANVLNLTGYQVIRQYYDNNLGTQVDIFVSSIIYIMKSRFGAKVELNEEEKKQNYSGEYLEELADKITDQLNISKIEQIDQSKDKIHQLALEILFEEIIATCEKLGIEFDEITHESSLQEEGKTETVVKDLVQKGYTKEKEEAIWFYAGEESLEDRESVLVRNDGRPTYFADDLAYHKMKFEKEPDLVIDILGSTHHGHLSRLVAGVAALGFDTKNFKFILYQFVRVKKGKEIVKMSKRAGNFITAQEVLEEVGKDAFRFFLLSHSPNAHIDFDIDLAKKRNEENPVYYVQYAHARLSSILRKSPKISSKINYERLNSPEELSLMRKILIFPDLVLEVSENFATHQLVFYAIEVADLFHSFYEQHRVINDEDRELTAARLELIKAVRITLANCLKLLGIGAPEAM